MKKRILGEKKEKLKKKKQTKFIKNLSFKKIVYKILKILILLVVIYNTFFLVNNAIYKNEYIKYLKINILCMKTDSMKDDINKWSLVVIKKVNEDNLKNNDIIAYEINGDIKISKLINQYINDDGKKVYIAKANLNYYPDNKEILYNQIIGKKICSIAGIGIFIKIIQSKIVSFIIFIILILIFFNVKIKIKRIERINRNKCNKNKLRKD
jgi:hypothetical protein